jgi:hypothetical protein
MAIKINNTTVIDNSRVLSIASVSTVASQAQAEAGTNNDQIMTPLRVVQAINANSAGISEGKVYFMSVR